ncbi:MULTISPECIES: bifunctional 2-keto-4-hydroxyglutarate aldolase/2-keto-3-deoxy-6-phosphogluconate aldolase [Aerococcus]|uniref:Bifunctional 4-hydroxy-2-oxoglutarate aldolase/2-dehydro-3-deoxy-phosphogluconate aldolase n=1 Tax=Aerococcus sanguinicola TaxID=119206 RepID=A0A5N1GJL0_9LACT|nr:MULTISPECIES: bifunctional 2-keto-4-hydroxyglutarate aldolase/2-keto-3-deoxy-6-phosphogluconate aldolase [Aerococcus]KAA9300478.1 bifunctional 4-hydroxy-2-oxoglutarate aldolase/2-dehydro-3-deoxy-phosphogluconate aldolase [Aerococcus sanguinicola]MDK6369709.1 bifunctional 2-keto-4-hydroxyglutarate aldolase/2-keto-3-deoxy-6-phosphogluconate aldolase [Aerococcus sp. UMB9870]MDK6680349.1 bifunctional 2-keto-4-hydroxyglutarate aldolase/2-keto-3-deoxy-6-phosphogluconate aldolase [Aerococcus sp. UMB
MAKKAETIVQMKENYLFAVIRGESEEDGYVISKACYEGGVKNIEVTFSTPGAERVMARLAEEFKGTDMVVGAGTVLDPVTARIAILNGADFIVSPAWNPEVAKICNLYTVPYLPGCGSATEIQEALTLGCEIVKVFPGGVLGSGFIKDIHGPLPQVELMPSGGVNIDNMEEWINKGAWAVGVGSALTKNYKAEGAEGVKATAKEFADRLAAILADK